MSAIRYLASNGSIAGGDVLLNGVDLLELTYADLRRVWGNEIGIVYQSPLSALNPCLRIGTQLAGVAQTNLKLSRREASDRARDMLIRVAMRDPVSVMRSYPHQLSGGMLQRCVIAMALITNPKLLILDEPTTALDVTTQAVVLDLVEELKNQFDSAILYITHDLGVITRICDRVAVMYAGEIVEEAPLRSLFKHPKHPYTLALIGCIPKFDGTASRRYLPTIPGSIPRLDELPPGCVFAPRCDLVEPECREACPPLVECGSGDLAHHSACRRWAVVPAPADYLRRTSRTLATPVESESSVSAVAAVTDLRVVFKQPGLFRSGKRSATVKAVDGVDLIIEEGRTLGVVGESGSGKTTVARAVAGLTPASSGSIALRGETLAGSTRGRTREELRDIQMVFQNPEASLNPRRSVGDQVARPLVLLGGCGHKEARQRAEALLQAVHLPPGHFDRLPAEISGGEKQRVAIARAFAAQPGLILCDEPISSLDVSVQGALMNLLMELQQESDTAYLFISHDLSAVQHLSSTIAVVYLGRVVEAGDASRVLSPPFHPYTEALLSAVPVPDPDVKQKAVRLTGTVPSALHVPPGCRFHPRCPRCLGRVCETEEPPARAVTSGHVISCHIDAAELRRLQKDASMVKAEAGV